MLMGGKASTMISADEAIKGSPNELEVTNKHFITGNPIKPPFDASLKVATFATGCFWGAEKGFWRMPGVSATSVGYTNGFTENATYEQVCSGKTGHAEAVQVIYDPSKISYTDLLRMFWQCHDPTQGMGQGGDRGSQYRSGIYTSDPDQMALAEASKMAYQAALRKAGKGMSDYVTTEVTSGGIYYFAEDYHQQYLAKPKARQYCSAQPTEVPLPPFTEWAPAGLADKHQPRLPEAYWVEHGPKPHCVIAGPNSQIVWP